MESKEQAGKLANLNNGEKEGLIVTIVGVGLISGSFALALKDKGFAKKIIGVSRTAASLQKAKELGIIDEILPLEEAVKQSDFIYVATPAIGNSSLAFGCMKQMSKPAAPLRIPPGAIRLLMPDALGILVGGNIALMGATLP